MVPELKSNPEPARILVIEDEVLIRCLIAEELREAGFTVIETQNADEASSYLKCGTSGRIGPAEVGGAIRLLPKPYELRHAVALVRSALGVSSDWQ